MTVSVEYIGTVADIPDDFNLNWSGYDSQEVVDSLRSEGFEAGDLEEFSNFLVKTETGAFTEIYGIKTNTPWLNTPVYRFRKNGRFI